MQKLNLGCWGDYKEGWVNVDVNKQAKADVYHNLDKFPYPFKDNTFDVIYLSHVLEHLEDPMRVVKELWRISKPKGKVIIKVPHWSSYLAHHPEHKTYYSSETFKHFEINENEYYDTNAGFKVLKKEFKTMKTNRAIWKPVEWVCRYILEPILNTNSLLTDQILCKFLPINEIHFVLEAKK